MRINVLQHTPNEGPGSIQSWAADRGHEMYIYHPYQFGHLPSIDDTDMLVILGGPMSPNDDFDWIRAERDLIRAGIKKDIPIFGACYGAQQIAKSLGYGTSKSPVKEVGFAPVYLESDAIPGIPKQLTALHWHEETFALPKQAQLLFSSDLLRNQGFVMNHRIVGLQFHFEPLPINVREMVINDGEYATDNALDQGPKDILSQSVPKENQEVMNKILDYITSK